MMPSKAWALPINDSFESLRAEGNPAALPHLSPYGLSPRSINLSVPRSVHLPLSRLEVLFPVYEECHQEARNLEG
jgi:hypothetical protein